MQEKDISGDLFVEDRKDSLPDSDDGFLLAVDRRPSAERVLLRKLDTRLLPTIVVIYIMNYIDRTAVTSARLQGLEHDLHLSVQHYFSGSIRRVLSGPNTLEHGLCAVLWGLTSLLAGVTKNFAGLLACRIFIGFPEARRNFVYTIYTVLYQLIGRFLSWINLFIVKELALRSAILYSGLIISNAFGTHGCRYTEWNGGQTWRSSLEMGAVTIFIGLQALWLLPDYPHNTRWLSAAERRLAQARIAEDAGEADEDGVSDTPWEGLKLALKDPKVYLFAMISFSELLGMGFINFFPTLTATLGFSTTITLLIAAPPWILTAILCVVNARHADKTGERFWHISVWWWSVILGFIIAQSTMSVGGRYTSLFFLASGQIGFAMTLVRVSNSIPRPPTKRAASIGIVNGFGNIGNLVSSFVWKVEWSPQYRPSMMIGISSMFVAICLAYVVRMMLIRENRLLDHDEMGALKGTKKERIDQAARLEGITVEEAMNKKRGFRYLY
ncbi:hypothetical protein CVT25_011590 [Psilocybe cyanescens]|uniref:Major facilitator superfamily (MFS) profile domain-containing protein n=1 Tax=Psilocybe cyanescens TaxID=93625 RepID=A0A409XCM5_PSICY|nr:hypothetical protein CVT25_011590 [Psilocybe cyanescens]